MPGEVEYQPAYAPASANPTPTTRARSEDQIIDVLFDRGCRVFILFALLDSPELWKLSTDKELRLETCCQDPLRMETWRRLVQRCVGPSVNLSGVQGEQVDRGKWRVVEPVSGFEPLA